MHLLDCIILIFLCIKPTSSNLEFLDIKFDNRICCWMPLVFCKELVTYNLDLNSGTCCHCCFTTAHRSLMCFGTCTHRVDGIPAKGVEICLFAVEL